MDSLHLYTLRCRSTVVYSDPGPAVPLLFQSLSGRRVAHAGAIFSRFVPNHRTRGRGPGVSFIIRLDITR